VANTARIETLLDQEALMLGHGPDTGDRLRPGLPDRQPCPPETGSACGVRPVDRQISAEQFDHWVAAQADGDQPHPPGSTKPGGPLPKARPLAGGLTGDRQFGAGGSITHDRIRSVDSSSPFLFDLPGASPSHGPARPGAALIAVALPGGRGRQTPTMQAPAERPQKTLHLQARDQPAGLKGAAGDCTVDGDRQLGDATVYRPSDRLALGKRFRIKRRTDSDVPLDAPLASSGFRSSSRCPDSPPTRSASTALISVW